MSPDIRPSRIKTGETLRQTTNTIVMVSPDHFGFNPQTAVDNAFQIEINSSEQEIKQQALREWTSIVALLEQNGIEVLQLPTAQGERKPDAVFPNNWFTHHEDGTLVLYPMRADNRSLERQPEALQAMLTAFGAPVRKVLDLSYFEKRNPRLALEGTGSLILDRVNKVAFAIGSPRADQEPFDEFCRLMGYEGIFFHAQDKDGKPIYHTNVMMSVGTEYAILVPEVITDDRELSIVTTKLAELGKEIISVTYDQMLNFGANVLELKGSDGPIIIASNTAIASYNPEQLAQFAHFGRLVGFDMKVLETIGGGSARCIMAEVFK